MPQIVLNGTTGIANATWTTATRPASPVAGQTGYNTDIGAMETYTGSAWSTSDLPATGASGNFLQSNGTAWTSASTLGVANGGTGVTTLTTAYGVLAAGTTATGALQNIGTGTASQVLTSNGPGVLPSFQAAAAGGFSNMTVYTSPGTFTTPSTTTKIKVTVVGGGAGANPSGGSSASPGGTSSFGVLASATGGSATADIWGGSGGAGSAGTLLLNGGVGGASTTTLLGMGGSSILGFGQTRNGIGYNGIAYGGGAAGTQGTPAPTARGGGGGGGAAIYVGPVSASTGYSVTVGPGGAAPGGGAGAAGVVIVEY